MSKKVDTLVSTNSKPPCNSADNVVSQVINPPEHVTHSYQTLQTHYNGHLAQAYHPQVAYHNPYNYGYQQYVPPGMHPYGHYGTHGHVPPPYNTFGPNFTQQPLQPQPLQPQPLQQVEQQATTPTPAKRKKTSKGSKEEAKRLDMYKKVNLVLLRAKNEANSPQNLAVRLMLKLFTKSEILDPLVTVTGKKPKGDGPTRRSLSPNRVNFIQGHVYSMVNTTEEEKRKLWKACVTAMHKKLSFLRKKNAKGEPLNLTSDDDSEFGSGIENIEDSD